MISFEYRCDRCGGLKTSDEMDSFICECGGQMRLSSGVDTHGFEPFYSKELGAHITSARQEEKLLKEKGLSYMSDHKGMVKKARQFKREQESMTRDRYEKQGYKYQPNSNVLIDEKTGAWVDRVDRKPIASKRTYFTALALLFLSSVASARLEGIEYTTVMINGEVVDIPLANKEYTNEVFYLKKLLNGDKEAREIFLGGNKERWFFIGDERPKWLLIKQDSEEVVIP